MFGTAPSDFALEVARLIQPGDYVLDLGCGEGRDSVFFATLGAVVTGVDLSADGIAKGKRLARARGVRVVEPGWTQLYPRKADEAKEDEQELPEFRVGEAGPHEPAVRKGETAPPRPYTEATLLGAMETAGKLVDDEELKEALKERGLGTPATRAAIIETLLDRGYIARERKSLVATDLGRYDACKAIARIYEDELHDPEKAFEWLRQAYNDLRAHDPAPRALSSWHRPSAPSRGRWRSPSARADARNPTMQ